MKEIPLNALTSQRFQIILAGQECVIKLFSRDGNLYIDLKVGNTDVCLGVLCLDGVSVVQFKSPYFKGSLHFFDTEGVLPPRWEGLGSRYLLLYAEEGGTLDERFIL